MLSISDMIRREHGVEFAGLDHKKKRLRFYVITQSSCGREWVCNRYALTSAEQMTVNVSLSIPYMAKINSTRLRVGLISDTHGLLRPEAKDNLRGCDFIVHGGDIGNPRILHELSVIAPVTAVRGNNDKGHWAENLNEDAVLTVGEIVVYVIHDIAALQMDPYAAGIHVVVSGHSHIPSIKKHEGVLYVNPGSSGPRRFKLPIAIGELIVSGHSVSASIVELGAAGAT